jgi:hypothetical protein
MNAWERGVIIRLCVCKRISSFENIFTISMSYVMFNSEIDSPNQHLSTGKNRIEIDSIMDELL